MEEPEGCLTAEALGHALSGQAGSLVLGLQETGFYCLCIFLCKEVQGNNFSFVPGSCFKLGYTAGCFHMSLGRGRVQQLEPSTFRIMLILSYMLQADFTQCVQTHSATRYR